MDPCPFVRLVIGNLSLKFSGGVAGIGNGNPPPPSNCYCKIKLKNSTTQITDVAYCDPDSEVNQVNDQVQACFNFTKSEFDKLVEKSKSKSKSNGLKIEVYSGRKGSNPICGVGSGKLIGVVWVGLDSKLVDGVASNWGGVVVQNGWVAVGDRSSKKSVQLHLNVRVEPDPRFVFEFDGEPECSPQVFQVNGNLRQAVFTCKFSLNLRSSLLDQVKSEKEKNIKERKGWSITIHDLSGSPVAMASMVTPFVPSHGTDDVRRSNPGAWLIMRPGHSTWKPWGRLEAWREAKSTGGDHLGYRFELLPDAAAVGGLDPITLSNSTINSKQGGKFTIDIGNGTSPMTTPTGSFDSGSGSVSGSGSDFWSATWAHLMYQGFVMSSKVAGGGRCSKPEVEIGFQHVTCTEDAAAFVALAAAVDLSVDACQPFSRKLRKELRHDGE